MQADPLSDADGSKYQPSPVRFFLLTLTRVLGFYECGSEACMALSAVLLGGV